jgi:hypothetical protein
MIIEKRDLYNLDVTLAEIILKHLVAFKGIHRHGILYSHEFEKDSFIHFSDFSDDTEWFLDELIWTFSELTTDASNSENETLFMKNATGKAFTEEEKAKWDNIMDETKAREIRINNGLRLFGKYFRHLWD